MSKKRSLLHFLRKRKGLKGSQDEVLYLDLKESGKYDIPNKLIFEAIRVIINNESNIAPELYKGRVPWGASASFKEILEIYRLDSSRSLESKNKFNQLLRSFLWEN